MTTKDIADFLLNVSNYESSFHLQNKINTGKYKVLDIIIILKIKLKNKKTF